MGVTPEDLAQIYPLLYHMADARSWKSIRKHGLLSTSSLLDLFGINGEERDSIEERRRPECVEIASREYGYAVVRDQRPLIESKLAKSLRHCTLPQWYRLLNRHVFFWLTKQRLQTLLCARAYRDKPHAVLTIETLPFVKRYEGQIVLSPMNSGNTQPFAHARCPAIFKKMRDYPFEERAKYGDQYQVVELAVESGADVSEMVLSVDLMKCYGKGARTLENMYHK
jgi:uncharacterized protein DUF7002